MDCRTHIASGRKDPGGIPLNIPQHMGERSWERQSKIRVRDILNRLLMEKGWTNDVVIGEFQRIVARMQNGDIVDIGDSQMLYLRQLGHLKSILHMFNSFYFDNLFGIRRNEINRCFEDNQGNEVEWEKLVDEINTRKELWAAEELYR